VNDREEARRRLVEILQHAYSGELAAAHAYRGHANSVNDPSEKQRIRQIEDEEWVHREEVGRILEALGGGPDPRRERKLLLIGKSIAAFCHVGGWFAPMWGAGKLERSNIVEYEDAAELAVASGHPEFVDCLLVMAEVEWEHEKFFREKAASHWLSRVLPVWAAPPPKETIREKRRSLSAVLAAGN